MKLSKQIFTGDSVGVVKKDPLYQCDVEDVNINYGAEVSARVEADRKEGLGIFCL